MKIIKLEVLNASMIEDNIRQRDRLEKLNDTAKRELEVLINDKNIVGISRFDKNQVKLLKEKNDKCKKGE